MSITGIPEPPSLVGHPSAEAPPCGGRMTSAGYPQGPKLRTGDRADGNVGRVSAQQKAGPGSRSNNLPSWRSGSGSFLCTPSGRWVEVGDKWEMIKESSHYWSPEAARIC